MTLVLGCMGGEYSGIGEERVGTAQEANAEVRLEVKLERSLEWLQMHLPWIAWKKSRWGMAAGKVEVLVVSGLDWSEVR